MIEKQLQTLLLGQKNLLAFSAGGDSVALFFLLLEHHIPFDIAIVDYNLREQSKAEVAYAQTLAKEYGLVCHHLSVEKIEKNMEAQARKVRYSFFEELIKKHSYKNLLTAHHLGDRFEWMLMQFCKGAGCVELSGMQKLQQRDNYTLIRPLLSYDKEELLHYLKKYNKKYFEDESNYDEKILRNSFRHRYSQPLLQKYKEGIVKSFEYIEQDKESLIQEVEVLHVDEMYYFASINQRSDVYTIDKVLKTLGYLLSANERKLLQQTSSLVVGRKYLISKVQNHIYITPYKKIQTTFSKEFKESCRKLKIEPKMRVFLYENEEAYKRVVLLSNK